MTQIQFTQEEKSAIVERIKQYFSNELKQEIGQFDAEFLLDFFAEELGAYFYNRGLYDARQVFENTVAAVDEAIYAIEKDIKAGVK